MWVARHFVMLARERFWESVRLDKFPDRPSRQRCLCLCPSLENRGQLMGPLLDCVPRLGPVEMTETQTHVPARGGPIPSRR
jgi:hypothetical protein